MATEASEAMSVTSTIPQVREKLGVYVSILALPPPPARWTGRPLVDDLCTAPKAEPKSQAYSPLDKHGLPLEPRHSCKTVAKLKTKLPKASV